MVTYFRCLHCVPVWMYVVCAPSLDIVKLDIDIFASTKD